MEGQPNTTAPETRTKTQKPVLTLDDLKQKMTEIKNLRQEALDFKPPPSEKEKDTKHSGIAGWIRSKNVKKQKDLAMTLKNLKRYNIFCHHENTYEKREDGSDTKTVKTQLLTFYKMESPPPKKSDGSLDFEKGAELDKEYQNPLNEIFNVTYDFNVALKTAVSEWKTEKRQKERETENRSKLNFANKYIDIIRLATKKSHI